MNFQFLPPAGQKLGEKIPCECGCGRSFTRMTVRDKYYSETCKSRIQNQKKSKRDKMKRRKAAAANGN